MFRPNRSNPQERRSPERVRGLCAGPRFLAVVLPWVLSALALSGARAQEESEFYAWDTPPPEEQRDAEAMIIPWGQGSIFVPTMTDPE